MNTYLSLSFANFEHFSCFGLVWKCVQIFFAANFALPQAEAEGEETPLPLFKEIIFTELDREEAAKVVEEYNKVPKVLVLIFNKLSIHTLLKHSGLTTYSQTRL